MNQNKLSKPSSFETIFEEISTFYTDHAVLSKELIVAREDYFKLTGKLNETDANFTNRMNAFLLWFTFDWVSKQSLKTPIQIFSEELNLHRKEPNTFQIQDLKNHVHSLFELKKLNVGNAIISDLFTKDKY